jgi:hypothetical protein
VCDDGLDNDLDGFIDFPADTGCASSTFPTENPTVPALSYWPTAIVTGSIMAIGFYRARRFATFSTSA